MPSLSVDDKGSVILSITVRNTHPHLTMWLAGADLTLKQDGLVFGYLPISCRDDIGPGQTEECSKDTGLSEEEYDALNLTFGDLNLKARFDDIDESMLTGEVVLIEESLNWRAAGDGSILFLGEVLNDTNGFLTIQHVEFHLYDTKDNYLGVANDKVWVKLGDVMPHATYAFAVGNEDIPYAKVERWEVSISYIIRDIYFDAPIATSATSASWGQIKAGR